MSTQKLAKNDFFCTNCGAEFELKETGIFIRTYDNSITHFCPNCGWIEVLTKEDLDNNEDLDKMIEERNEKGNYRFYSYPDSGKIIRMPPQNWVEIHNKELAKQG